jgi:hypothetical protein
MGQGSIYWPAYRVSISVVFSHFGFPKLTIRILNGSIQSSRRFCIPQDEAKGIRNVPEHWPAVADELLNKPKSCSQGGRSKNNIFTQRSVACLSN